jgi:hypothetical protein
MNPEKLLKPSTLAEKIGKSTRWINAMLKSGKLRSITIDGVRFVDISEGMPIPSRPGRKKAEPNV